MFGIEFNVEPVLYGATIVTTVVIVMVLLHTPRAMRFIGRAIDRMRGKTAP